MPKVGDSNAKVVDSINAKSGKQLMRRLKLLSYYQKLINQHITDVSH